MVTYRVSIFACFIALIHLSSFIATAHAIESPSNYPEAIGFFAQEKTTGESGAALLKMFRDKIRMGEYARGAQSYAKAKSAFDGLIRQLDAEAGEVQDRANSERFQSALRKAAEARIAFTNYVETTLGPNLEGTRFPYDVLFTTAAELLPKLVEAWNKLWEARRQVQQEGIMDVRKQLNAVTWRSFNDIEAIQ